MIPQFIDHHERDEREKVDMKLFSKARILDMLVRMFLEKINFKHYPSKCVSVYVYEVNHQISTMFMLCM